MKRFAIVLTAAAAGLGSPAAAQQVRTLGTDTVLVDPAWLASRLPRGEVVLFHIGPRPDYDSAHIAGAQYLSLRELARFDQSRHVLLDLPDPAVLDSVLEARGVSDATRVVLYWSSSWVSPTTRALLTLTWIGHGERTSILDGGLAAWRAAGHAVTREVPPAPAPGRFTARPRDDVVVAAPFVLAQVERGDWTIVDARNTVFYTGERQGNGIRSGRIPGARSVPFVTVADSSDRFLGPEGLRRLFAAACVEAGRPLVAYCHVGQQATAVWLAARLAGHEARVYDGSFEEWSRVAAYPTVTTPAAERQP